MRIVLAIYSLSGAGGAERVMTTMANYWSEKGWAVTIITFDDGSKPPFYRLHPAVKLVVLNLKSKTGNIIGRIYYFLSKNLRVRRCLLREKPDVIISFTAKTNMKVLRAMLFTKIPVIVSERNSRTRVSQSFFQRKYRNCLYRNSRFIVCQTRAMRDALPARLQRQSIIIPNPVKKAGDQELNPEPPLPLPEGKLLFAVSHMSREKIYQKGIDLLIPVFARLAAKHSQWQLVILNDGPEKHLVVQEIARHKLEGRVFLPGKTKDIFSTFNKGHLFVLASRYEGFPNALCEAMACGLPVVSFDCPTGPADIIRHGTDGFLVPAGDTAGLEQALDRLMGDAQLRRQMSRRAAEIVDRFSLEKVMALWEQLICG